MENEIHSQQPTAIDLFSGCGGLSEGLKQAGFNVIGAVECDALAVETYLRNHSQTHVVEAQIQHTDPAELRKRLQLEPGELDLLAGCPPCQGFSTLTSLNGKVQRNDVRNDLVFEFVRYVGEFLPRAIMMENVPGLAKDGRLPEVRRRLFDLGYHTDMAVLNAADFAVPQRRKRMIMLGGFNHQAIPFAPRAEQRRTVADAFKALLSVENDPLHDTTTTRSERIRALIRSIPKDGGSRYDLDADQQLPCHQKCDGFKDVYGRMSWNKVAPTITGGCYNPSKGRFLHPEEDRVITMREAALLQSFPVDYYFSLRRGKTSVSQMIGNALPPEFIRRQALQVISKLAECHP